MSQETEVTISGVSKAITIVKGLQIEPEKVSCQIKTDATYDGVLDTVKLQQSNDGTSWNDITDNDGNVLTVTLTAASDTFLLLTSIFYSENIRAFYTRVDGTVGVLTFDVALKQ